MQIVRRYSITEAKDRFSELVRLVERGEVVTVTRRGRAVAGVVSESEFHKLQARRRKTGWSEPAIDTSSFRFERQEANPR